jgi:hypothetical protein
MARSDDGATLGVVVPSRDRHAWVARAARSALAHRAVSEVIVVDDGSDPPVDLSAISDRRLRTIRRGGGGVSAARNAGLAAARSSHLAFLDDDDRLLPWAGRTMMGWIAAGGGAADRIDVGAVLIDRPGASPRRRWQIVRPPSSRAGEVWGLDAHLLAGGRSFATKQAAVLPRTMLERVGGWDETMRTRETSELFMRLSQIAPVEGHGWPVYRLDRGVHDRLTKDTELRRASVERIRLKHAALLADPARRATFEDNHASMLALAEAERRAASGARA